VISFDVVLTFHPSAALGLAMLASGVKGLQQYWLELMITINAPVGLLLGRVDLTMFTAKFATLSCLIGLKSLPRSQCPQSCRR